MSSDGNDGGIPATMPKSGFHNGSLVIKKGDHLRVDGYYAHGPSDSRILPMPAGPHLGVMSYFYIAYTGSLAPPNTSMKLVPLD